MNFVIRHDYDNAIRFSGELTTHDLQALRLDRFDRMQLGEPAQHASDALLDLELIFRRLEQQQESGR